MTWLLCFRMRCEKRRREGKDKTLPVIRRPVWGVFTQLLHPRKRCPSSTLSLTEHACAQHASGFLGTRLAQLCSTCVWLGSSAYKMKPTQRATCGQATESQADALSSREGTSSDHGAEVRARVFKHPIYIEANKTSYW